MHIEWSRKVILPSVVLVVTSMSAAASQADEFIAGIEPWQRPANAPVITVFAKDGAWYGKALTGVEQPYPASLRFLEDQGAWYTPFNRPGLTGPYDLRNWHHPVSDGESRSVSGR